jgi:hypothetical protein
MHLFGKLYYLGMMFLIIVVVSLVDISLSLSLYAIGYLRFNFVIGERLHVGVLMWFEQCIIIRNT